MLKDSLTGILEKLGLAIWIEVVTESPRCTYYFGPFATASEAEAAKLGYLEDLESEGATGIAVLIKRCKPEKLTVYEENVDFKFECTPRLSVHSL